MADEHEELECWILMQQVEVPLPHKAAHCRRLLGLGGRSPGVAGCWIDGDRWLYGLKIYIFTQRDVGMGFVPELNLIGLSFLDPPGYNIAPKS